MGSQLRGAFGYALKKVTCLNPPFKKGVCFAGLDCLYCNFFEIANSFHQYRFDIALGSDTYEFSLYLFDIKSNQIPYILNALHVMLSENGLGKEKKVYKDFTMLIDGKNCIKNGQMKLPAKIYNVFIIDDFCENITLDFITPLRIKKNNMLLRNGNNLQLQDIINSIYKRQMGLLRRDFKKFPYKIEGKIINKQLRYKELTRLSNRQKTTMNLGGLIGSMEIQGLNKESYEVLKLGELLAVGKQTVFGLGKIKVQRSR